MMDEHLRAEFNRLYVVQKKLKHQMASLATRVDAIEGKLAPAAVPPAKGEGGHNGVAK